MTAQSMTAPRVEHISAARDTDLATRTGQMRYLVSHLSISRPQAHAMIRAYERDVADAVRIGNDTRRPDSDFIDWLMRQAPTGRRRAIKRHEWRVVS